MENKTDLQIQIIQERSKWQKKIQERDKIIEDNLSEIQFWRKSFDGFKYSNPKNTDVYHYINKIKRIAKQKGYMK